MVQYIRGMAEKRKQSLYFPEDMLEEITKEANRQDRSISWIVQQSWKIAKPSITAFPGTEQFTQPKP